MEVQAFAKVNLTLEVLGRREDGYHEVKTILQTIDLGDKLEISASPTLQVECDDPSLRGEANLIWKAAVDLAKYAQVEPQARIRVEKKIPASMGLGGGSSDAASTLAALNIFWGVNVPVKELAEVASGLGSDVPFFLWGGVRTVTTK